MTIITGPFVKTALDVRGSDTYSKYQRWFRQKPGIVYALGYDLEVLRYTTGSGNAENVAQVGRYEDNRPGVGSVPYQKAYDAFAKSLGARVSMGINLLEAGSSAQMLLVRLRQLNNIRQAVVRRDFSLLVRSLADSGANQKKVSQLKRRDLARNPANTWLEIQFGWLPIISDMYGLVEVMQSEFRLRPLKGRGQQVTQDYFFGWCPVTQVKRVEIAATIKVTNPNLLLANQLGLVNPLSVAWDAVPGSFLLDWFLPVKKFIDSYSAFAGVELLDIRVTHTIRGEFQWSDPTGVGDPPNKNRQFDGRFFVMRRYKPGSLEVPDFGSRIRMPKVDSWRLATLASLVAQSLSARLDRR